MSQNQITATREWVEGLGFLEGSGTTSQIPFYTGSTQITGSDNLKWDNIENEIIITGSTKLDRLKFNDSTSYLGVSNDVRNWYLTGKQLNVATEDSGPNGIFFKPDGTRFYIVGTTNDRVRAYDMSIPWDITTAVIAESFSVSIEATPADLFFKPDGTVLYIIGNTTDLARQFTLPTPWILTGATASGTFNIATQDPAPTGIYFSPDGIFMYIAGVTTPVKVIQYVLTTPWDITTASFLQQFSVSAQETGIQMISFNNDGTRMYILGASGDDITEYRLSVPWDISTSVYFSESFTFVQEGTPTGLFYDENQGRAYIVGTGADTIYELGTEKQVKVYTDSMVTDSQMYVGGRFETKGTIYSNSSITALGGLISTGTIIGLGGTNIGSDTLTFLQSSINLGGATTIAVPFSYNTNITNGRMYSGQTKNINIARNSQYDSNTFVTIGDANSGKTTSTLDTFFKRDVNVLGSLSVSNNVSPVISSSVATGTINVYDTFTEATNTLLNLHLPDTGSTWSRVEIPTFTSPTFTVFSTGNMGVTSAVNNQGVIYRQDTILTNPNYEVSVDLITQATSDDVMWLMARYQNFDNFYGVKWSSTLANCGLYRKNNGVYTLLSTLLITPILGVTSLTLRVFDGFIVVLNGGNVVMTAYDESITSAGYAAIGAGNILQAISDDFATWRFDNFKVQSYADYTNSYIENGKLGIGLTEPTQDLHVAGNVRIEGSLYDSINSSGTTGQILKSTETGTTWTEDTYLQKSTGTTYTTNAILTVTQAEYDAIVTKDPTTLYFIV